MNKPERLVVDANPILSALLGGAARRIFFETDIKLFAVPELVLTEVQRYLPRVAEKLRVSTETLIFTLDLLPITLYLPRQYAATVAKAKREIAHRDPDDVDVLALTMKLDIPLWSNDHDFEDSSVEQWTTAQLLHRFFPRSRKSYRSQKP